MGRLRDELAAYFEALTLRRQGYAEKVPPKPEMLIEYEQTKSLGLPMFAGGLSDQPHLWIQFYRVCDDAVKVYYAAEELALQQKISPVNSSGNQEAEKLLKGMPNWMREMFG